MDLCKMYVIDLSLVGLQYGEECQVSKYFKTECIHVCNIYRNSLKHVIYMCAWLPPKGKRTDVGRQVCEKVALARSAVLPVTLSERGSDA